MAGRGKRGPDIAGEVRRQMMLALRRIDANAEGDRLVDILERELMKDPLAVLKAVAPWVPKEVIADVDITPGADDSQLPETAAWLAEAIGEGAEASSEDSAEAGSILPPPLRTQ